MKTKLAITLQEGDQIILPEFDNGDEVIPAERAIVDGIQRNGMVTCTVIKADRPKGDRDGLREVTLEGRVQIWSVR